MKEELIGKKVTIVDSTNASLKGVEGTIIDETMNTFSIETDGKVKTVVKDQCVFDIEGKTISGKDIMHRPEERIKK